MRFYQRAVFRGTWPGLFWVLALLLLSLYLWGVVFTHTDWIGWFLHAGRAVAGGGVLLFNTTEVIWGLAVLLAGFFAGRFFLRRLVDERPCFSLSLCFGLVVLSLAAVALGSAGFFKPLFLIAAVSAALIGGGADFAVSFGKGAKHDSRYSGLRPVEYLALLPGVLIVFISALNPTVSYDALSYHLALPGNYLITGSTSPLIWHPFSYFPSNSEMLMALGMAGGGVVSAQVVLCGVWLAGILAMRDLAVRFVSRESGPAVILAGSCTVTFALSVALVTADTLVFALSIAGLLCLCGAGSASEKQDAGALRGWLVAWAVMAGGAAGAKYTAWISVLALQGIFAAWIVLRSKGQKAGPALAALAAGLAVIFIWPLRNYISCGNPVMPVPVGGVFDGISFAAWQALKADAHAIDPGPGAVAGILSSPWRMVFSDWESLLDWGAARFIGPIIWMFAPLLLFVKKDFKVPWILWVYALAATGISVSSFRMIRFAYPGIAAFAVCAGLGMHALIADAASARRARAAAVVVIAAALLLCAGVLMRGTSNATAGYLYARTRGDLEAYLEEQARRKPADLASIPLQRRLAKSLPQDAVVFTAGETRCFFLDRFCIAPSFLSRNPLVEMISKSDAGDVSRSLAQSGVTHVFVSMPELARLSRQYGFMGADPDTMKKVFDFAHGKACETIAENRDKTIFACEIKSSRDEP